ncbi:uncharacterized protein DSM5745_00751 [Aspergillus mulundensis]|uniref:Uncharacterized protein n=1 Tax=Aspergillus mulundensis TaxID=1810919 RepID=A0A3D8T4H5_9EURO|nr:hypothetical protein DSM5745_00751 [Aspergillus mulundensis]RDW93429.1 hypothetical protein DSM5745_00751 [Aspergillus mulundensis]
MGRGSEWSQREDKKLKRLREQDSDMSLRGFSKVRWQPVHVFLTSSGWWWFEIPQAASPKYQDEFPGRSPIAIRCRARALEVKKRLGHSHMTRSGASTNPNQSCSGLATGGSDDRIAGQNGNGVPIWQPGQTPPERTPSTDTDHEDLSDVGLSLALHDDEQMFGSNEGTDVAKGADNEQSSGLQPQHSTPEAGISAQNATLQSLALPAAAQRSTIVLGTVTQELARLNERPSSESTTLDELVAIRDKNIRCINESNNAMITLLEGYRTLANDHNFLMAQDLKRQKEENDTLRRENQKLALELQTTRLALTEAAQVRVRTSGECNALCGTVQKVQDEVIATQLALETEKVFEREDSRGCGHTLDEDDALHTTVQMAQDEQQVTHLSQQQQADTRDQADHDDPRIQQLEIRLKSEQEKMEVMTKDAEEMIDYVLRLQRTHVNQTSEIKSLSKEKEDLTVTIEALQRRLLAETEKVATIAREKEELQTAYQSRCDVQDSFLAGLKDMSDRLRY